MNSRERIKAIVAGKPADRCGLWLGNPLPEALPAFHAYFGTSTEEELRQLLHDDFRWYHACSAPVYKHPEGKPIFDLKRKGECHGEAGPFAECEDVRQVEDFEWPNPDYLDFSELLRQLAGVGDFYRASGFWSTFFHDVSYFFGVENYFIKMHTHPEIVHAVTRHVVDFYLEANHRFFTQAGDLVDAFFFGNDFGTQLDVLISPDAFNEFIFPYFKQLTDLGHRHGLQVILHSCGAIHKIIPSLIQLGVDALHPLQALAANMDADTLSRDFRGRVAFIGGVDTQNLLFHATPEKVRAEVRRVKNLLGPCFVVSPSQGTVFPMPPENLRAMAEEALATPV